MLRVGVKYPDLCKTSGDLPIDWGAWGFSAKAAQAPEIPENIFWRPGQIVSVWIEMHGVSSKISKLLCLRFVKAFTGDFV